MSSVEMFLTKYTLDILVGIHVYTYPDIDREDVDVTIPRPSGFQVYEIVNGLDLGALDLEKIVDTEECRGDTYLYIVEKVGFDTNEVCRLLKRIFKCATCEVLGLKDANAIVRQVAVLRRCDNVKRVLTLRNGNKFVKAILWQYNPVAIVHNGNKFRIELVTKNVMVFKNRLRYFSNYGYTFLNFYGYQRFGTKRPITHLLGRFIIKNEWDSFLKTLCDTYSRPRNGSIESIVCRNRFRYEDEFRVVKSIPKNMIKLYVNAYQSYLFNKTLSLLWLKLLDKHNFDEAFKLMLKEYTFIPVVGSKPKVIRSELKSLIDEILDEENITSDNFIIPELGLEIKGDYRYSMARALNIVSEVEQNRLYILFTLGRGSYATAFLRELLRVDPLIYT
jgi:tRNA pseudouridine13 synthase